MRFILIILLFSVFFNRVLFSQDTDSFSPHKTGSIYEYALVFSDNKNKKEGLLLSWVTDYMKPFKYSFYSFTKKKYKSLTKREYETILWESSFKKPMWIKITKDLSGTNLEIFNSNKNKPAYNYQFSQKDAFDLFCVIGNKKDKLWGMRIENNVSKKTKFHFGLLNLKNKTPTFKNIEKTINLRKDYKVFSAVRVDVYGPLGSVENPQFIYLVNNLPNKKDAKDAGTGNHTYVSHVFIHDRLEKENRIRYVSGKAIPRYVGEHSADVLKIFSKGDQLYFLIGEFFPEGVKYYPHSVLALDTKKLKWNSLRFLPFEKEFKGDAIVYSDALLLNENLVLMKQLKATAPKNKMNSSKLKSNWIFYDYQKGEVLSWDKGCKEMSEWLKKESKKGGPSNHYYFSKLRNGL